MNTVKKVITYLLTTILRPITDAVVIRAIEKGEISEREIVEKAKRKLIRSLDEDLPKCVDYDEDAAKGAAILKKRAMAAKTIDDMLKIQSESKELKYFNRVFKKATKQHDCIYTLKHYGDSGMNIKRYIDAKVRKEVRRRLVCDGLIDDLKKACDRGAEKLKAFATEYPSVAKIIRILLKISGTFNGIAAGTVVGANGIAYLAARSKRELDAAYEDTARMYGTTPGILKVGMIVGTISHILMAIIKFKVANALTPDTNGKKDASPFCRRHKTVRRKGLKKKSMI